MKRSRSNNMQTPIKKWQQMSPMEDELAIVESDLSSAEQPQLFTSLVGPSPFLDSPSPSSHQIQEEQSEYQSSPPFSSEDSAQEEFPHTVKEMKVEESFTEERLPLQFVDTNRKGCNCRHSQCQKGYCDCLRMGRTCDPSFCSCEGCQNLEQKEIHKKITKKLVKQSFTGKGCHCRKSKCLKKYCECHNAGRKCTSLCECVECCNMDENCEPNHGGSMLQKLRDFGSKPLNIYSE